MSTRGIERIYRHRGPRVNDGVEVQRMETPIRRERSCATCHFCVPGQCEPTETTVERIFVEEVAP